MAINWSLGQIDPNIATNALTAMRAGRQDRRQQDRENALRAYAQGGDVNALMAVDPEAGMQFQQALNGLKSLDDAFGVIQPVDAQRQMMRKRHTQLFAQGLAAVGNIKLWIRLWPGNRNRVGFDLRQFAAIGNG